MHETFTRTSESLVTKLVIMSNRAYIREHGGFPVGAAGSSDSPGIDVGNWEDDLDLNLENITGIDESD